MINAVHTTQETCKEALQSWYRNQAGKTKNTVTTERIGTGQALNTSLLSNVPVAALLYGVGTLMGKGKFDTAMGDGYDFKLLKKDANLIENIKKGYKGFMDFINSDGTREFIAVIKKEAYESYVQAETDKLMTKNSAGKIISYNWDYLKEVMQSDPNDMTLPSYNVLCSMYASMTEEEDIENFINCSYIINEKMSKKEKLEILKKYAYGGEQNAVVSKVDALKFFDTTTVPCILSPIFKEIENAYGKHMMYPLADSTIYNSNCTGFSESEIEIIKREMSKAAILENICNYGDFLNGKIDPISKKVITLVDITEKRSFGTFDYNIDIESHYTDNPAIDQTIKIFGLRNGQGIDAKIDKEVSLTLEGFGYGYDSAAIDSAKLVFDLAGILPSPFSIAYNIADSAYNTFDSLQQNIVINSAVDSLDFANKMQAASLSAIISKVGENYVVNYTHCNVEELQQNLNEYNIYKKNYSKYENYILDYYKYDNQEIDLSMLKEDFKIEDILNGLDKKNVVSKFKLKVFCDWLLNIDNDN